MSQKSFSIVCCLDPQGSPGPSLADRLPTLRTSWICCESVRPEQASADTVAEAQGARRRGHHCHASLPNCRVDCAQDHHTVINGILC